MFGWNHVDQKRLIEMFLVYGHTYITFSDFIGNFKSFCCRKGDPFQGLKLGSCLTLGNELSEETHADKARDFIGKGHPDGEQ